MGNIGDAPILSVVVATRDRPALLTDCLLGLAAQDQPAGRFEVIVVDDGSETPPAAVLTGARTAGLAVRAVRQEPAGLSVARNRGADESKGRIVAYLDDDVLVPPRWASEVIAAFETTGCDAMAGRVVLSLEADAPYWLNPPLRRYLTEFDPDRPAGWLSAVLPVGANCALERTWFTRLGGFRSDLGRRGESLASNEETEFFRRLVGSGGRIFYQPSAVVRHRVPAERLTSEWFRRRARAQGHSDIVLDALLPGPGVRAREALRAARAAPILGRGVLSGHGIEPARIWLSYCAGRRDALRPGRSDFNDG